MWVRHFGRKMEAEAMFYWESGYSHTSPNRPCKHVFHYRAICSLHETRLVLNLDQPVG